MVPCSSLPLHGPLPTVHRDEKTKEDTETHKEAMSTLGRLLNKYEEGKNRYQNLQDVELENLPNQESRVGREGAE